MGAAVSVGEIEVPVVDPVAASLELAVLSAELEESDELVWNVVISSTEELRGAEAVVGSAPDGALPVTEEAED